MMLCAHKGNMLKSCRNSVRCFSATSRICLARPVRRQQNRCIANPRRAVLTRASDASEGNGAGEDLLQEYGEPSTAKEAIDLGLKFCQRNLWSEALKIFKSALDLPGTGIKRFRDRPRLISDGEKMAALYNIACCHARLDEDRESLLALSACLELGYLDFEQIRNDPDLENARKDSRFEVLMKRYEPKPGSNFFSQFFGQK